MEIMAPSLSWGQEKNRSNSSLFILISAVSARPELISLSISSTSLTCLDKTASSFMTEVDFSRSDQKAELADADSISAIRFFLSSILSLEDSSFNLTILFIRKRLSISQIEAKKVFYPGSQLVT